MTKLRKGIRKSASLLLSAFLTMSVFAVAAPLQASAVSYSEMSALDAYAYSGNDLGATYSKSSTTFKVWSPTASDVKLKLYKTGSDAESGAAVIDTKAMTKGDKAVWSVTVQGDLNGTYYTYLVTNNGTTKETNDIYARTTGVNGMRAMVVDLDSTDPTGWENDKRVECQNQTDAIIWEIHVRDFSSSADSGMTNKGKFLAFTETGTTVSGDGVHPTGIDYLADLGVTHVHLLPVYDYDGEIDETKLSTDQFNWGYDPVNYNTPEGSYSTDPYHGEVRIKEFKQMVQALHNKGIGVVMDVVYNHTYGKNDWFDFTVPDYYYRQNAKGTQSNGSGCGNETASDRAMYRKYMIDSLTYWATEYHLDGFRFDLMGLHDCETMNQIRTAMDAIDPSIILYGEPWTAEATTCPTPTAVQGNMGKVSERIAAFNDKVRDNIKGSCFNAADKGFIQGEARFEDRMKGSIQAESTTMSGDSKWSKQPSQTVTYTSAHDNYTLYDKLVYSCKGGTGYNTRYDDLVAMNKMAGGIILTSQGMSFFQAGEEFARTKYGDHNSYKSATSTNQLVWSNTKTFSDLMNYYKGLIQIRKAYSPFRDPTNTTNGTIYFAWAQSGFPANVVAFTMYNKLNPGSEWDYVAVIHNANASSKTVTLMTYENKTLPSQWVIIADGTTAGLQSLGTTGSTVTVPPRSTMVLVDKTSFDNTVISSGGKVTVNHVLKPAGTTYKTETLKGKEGTSYTTSPLTELLNNGYKMDSVEGQTSGTFTKAGTTVTYYYTLDTTKYGTVTVKYKDAETGKTLSADEVHSELIGKSYSYSPKDIKGYECDPSKTKNASGTVVAGNTDVIFYYNESAVSTGLKVHYYNSNGWSQVAMYVYTENTSVKEYAGAWPGSIMQTESGGWYVGTVDTTDTVLFIANNNNQGSQDPAGVGTKGYSVSGEVWIKGGKVIPTGKVNVRYVTEDGTVLAKETLTGMADGTNTYTTSSKTFDGYELVSTPTNASGPYTQADITVNYVYKSKSVPVDPLVNNSKLSASTVKPDQSVTITCAASGGTTPYQYKITAKLGSNTTTVQDYSTTASASYTPKAEGTYTITVTVKDKSGTEETKNLTLTVKGDGPVPDPLVNKSTVSAAKINLGSSVTVNCAATGGTTPYQFAVSYKKPSDSGYMSAQGYSTNNKVVITPKAAATYEIKVAVKDKAGKTSTKTLNVEVIGTTLKNTSTLSASTISLGKSVTVNCSATGGTTPYQYAVAYKKDSDTSFVNAQSYSTNAKVTFTPKVATEYSVKITVKDKNSKTSTKTLSLIVTPPALENTSAMNLSKVTLGGHVVVTASATGGTKPYQYSVYYKKKSASNFIEVSGYSSDTKFTVKPNYTGDYTVRVKIKDGAGTIARKDFDLTVTKPTLTNKTTLSATSITLGGDIKVNCAATGGTAPYKYSVFYKKASASNYMRVQSYSTNKTVYITPQSAVKYNVRVFVKDANNTEKKLDFTVTVNSTKSIVNLSSIAIRNVELGDCITIHCAAANGNSPYKYAVYYKRASNTKYITKQDFSTNKTVDITPLAATTYDVQVKIKTALGTVKTKDFKIVVK